MAQLVITLPNGQLFHVLNIDELLTQSLSRTTITSAELTGYTTVFAETLSRYHLNRPTFPLTTLLQLTELGTYWLDLVCDAARLYDANQYDEFDAAFEEIITTIQIDMEEDHRIPYDKHRHYDTLLAFKTDYDGCLYCYDSSSLSYYTYMTSCLSMLQKAVAARCTAQIT
jgi:hypothetical protein